MATFNENDLQSLICSFCKKYLSVPPILISENGETYKCGRCPATTSEHTMRQDKLYELSAKYMSFPCSESKKCKLILAWEQVYEHEKKCAHRNILCPYSSCSEKFEMEEIEAHFRTNHPFNTHQNTKFSDYILKFKGENIYLISNNGSTFLYCRSTDNENMYFTVYGLTSNSHKFSVVFDSQTGRIQYETKCSSFPYYSFENYFKTSSLTINKGIIVNILGGNDDSACQKIELKISAQDVDQSTETTNLTGMLFENALRERFTCKSCAGLVSHKTRTIQSFGGRSACSNHQIYNGYGYSANYVHNFMYDNIYELCRTSFPAIFDPPLSTPTVANIIEKHVTRGEFEDLKCSYCDKFLSIPPIFTSAEGNNNKCGRCVDVVTEKSLHRNEMFEKLAKHVEFPCSESANCQTILKWNEAGKHESTCPHKKIICPDLNCTEKVEINIISDHFQKAHKSNFSNFTSNILIDLEINTPKVVLINSEGKDLVACFDVKDENVSFNIQSLSFLKRQPEYSISFIAHTCRIHLKENYPVCIFEENLVEKKGLIFDRSKLSQCLGLTETLTSFKIHVRIFHYPIEFAQSVRSNLECPVCLKVMDSIINLCNTGHSICNNCRKQIQTCPICRSGFSCIQNIPLQELYTLLNRYFPGIITNDD